jgi:hypothetical protein
MIENVIRPACGQALSTHGVPLFCIRTPGHDGRHSSVISEQEMKEALDAVNPGADEIVRFMRSFIEHGERIEAKVRALHLTHEDVKALIDVTTRHEGEWRQKTLPTLENLLDRIEGYLR